MNSTTPSKRGLRTSTSAVSAKGPMGLSSDDAIYENDRRIMVLEQIRSRSYRKGVLLGSFATCGLVLLFQTLMASTILLNEKERESLRHDRISRPMPQTHVSNSNALFNGIAIAKSQPAMYSDIHCVGGDLQERNEHGDSDNSWMFRSCHFSNLCFDTNSSEFVLLPPSPHAERVQEKQQQSADGDAPFRLSSSSNRYVAIGGINPRWEGKDFRQGIDKVKWRPRVLKETERPASVYMLPKDVVLVPFHSMAAHNVGHLVWDDWLPLYTLLRMFGLISDRLSLHLMRYVLPKKKVLYGACEIQPKKTQSCASNLKRFAPLMGPKTVISTSTNFTLSGLSKDTTLVCARHGAAGIGMLTDHGAKDHGWNLETKEDTDLSSLSVPHNMGRGPMLYDFRNFMVRNILGTASSVAPDSKSSPRIILSAHSSSDPERDLSMKTKSNMLKQAFGDNNVHLVQLSDMTLEEQVRVASNADFFVTTAGGGSVTATFLPRGSTLIVYYAEHGGVGPFQIRQRLPTLTNKPAYLDHDLFDHMSHVRVHWLPIGGSDTVAGLDMLRSLVRHEMEVQRELRVDGEDNERWIF